MQAKYHGAIKMVAMTHRSTKSKEVEIDVFYFEYVFDHHTIAIALCVDCGPLL